MCILLVHIKKIQTLKIRINRAKKLHETPRDNLYSLCVSNQHNLYYLLSKLLNESLSPFKGE